MSSTTFGHDWRLICNGERGPVATRTHRDLSRVKIRHTDGRCWMRCRRTTPTIALGPELADPPSEWKPSYRRGTFPTLAQSSHGPLLILPVTRHGCGVQTHHYLVLPFLSMLTILLRLWTTDFAPSGHSARPRICICRPSMASARSSLSR